jgi:hypothetical protein
MHVRVHHISNFHLLVHFGKMKKNCENHSHREFDVDLSSESEPSDCIFSNLPAPTINNFSA